MNRLWEFLHLFFAFSFVGSLVVAEWNGRAARATADWGQRALLFQIIHLSTRVAGVGGLGLLGLFGNILGARLGYSMASDHWMWAVNGLWLVAFLLLLLVGLPGAARLAAIARQAAGGGSSEGFEPALARWRGVNVAQSVLYLTLLGLMVIRRRF